MSDSHEELDAADDHYNETWPPSSIQAYIGKEHFWKAGESLDFERALSGRLFNCVVYPLALTDRILLPSDIGINVSDRKSQGIPATPDVLNISGNRNGPHERLHREAPLGNHLAPRDTVVRIDGVIGLAEHPEQMAVMRGLAKPKIAEQYQKLAVVLGTFAARPRWGS